MFMSMQEGKGVEAKQQVKNDAIIKYLSGKASDMTSQEAEIFKKCMDSEGNGFNLERKYWSNSDSDAIGYYARTDRSPDLVQPKYPFGIMRELVQVDTCNSNVKTYDKGDLTAAWTDSAEGSWASANAESPAGQVNVIIHN